MRSHRHVMPGVLACLLSLVTTASAWAQAPVTVSFRAIGESGQPVMDLKAADVALRMDGKPREIKSFELVTIGARATAGPSPSQPAYGSNTASDTGRDIIFVLDDESIAPGKETQVRDALRYLVSKLTPADRVGILSLRSSGVSIGATNDRAKITAAIEGLKGEASVNEQLSDFQCRTSQILISVKGLFEGATHAKTTLVFVSSGIAPLPPDQSRAQLGTSSGLCQLRPPHFSEVGQAAAASPAAAFVLHVVDGRATPSSDAQAGLESLAGVMASPLIRLAGSTSPALNRIVDETAAYYIAAFDVDAAERNGSPHKTEVRVSRPGVRIDAGTSVVLAKATGKAPAPKDMLRSAESFRDVPLRATGWALRDAGNKIKVMALFEPEVAGTKLTSAMIALIDGNRIAAQWTAQGGELDRTPVLAALLVTPGRYRLRVAATDAAAHGGAVDYPLNAQLTPAGSATMSGLTVGLADNGFKPRVLFGPSDQGAIGYLELYGVAKNATVTGTVELAPSEDAPAMATTPATVQPSTTEDMRIVVGGFSIGGLQPGDYVMRMVVSIDGKVAGTAMRTLSKVKQ